MRHAGDRLQSRLVSEIIEDGVTGYIVEDELSAISSVHRLMHLSRRTVRRRFEERFTARRMAKDYLDVYRGLLNPATPRLVSGPNPLSPTETPWRELARFELDRPRFRKGQQRQDQACRGNARQSQKGDAAAMAVGQVARKGRAHGGADAKGAANQALSQIKAPVPRVRSATISGTITPIAAAAMPSSTCPSTST